MTLKTYLWGMRSAALISLAVLVLIIRQIDPESSGAIGQTLFFATAFFFLASVFILFFTWLRGKAGGSQEAMVAYLSVSFRQGALIGILGVILLAAQRFRILTWWDGALMVVGILLVELYFLTRK